MALGYCSLRWIVIRDSPDDDDSNNNNTPQLATTAYEPLVLGDMCILLFDTRFMICYLVQKVAESFIDAISTQDFGELESGIEILPSLPLTEYARMRTLTVTIFLPSLA